MLQILCVRGLFALYINMIFFEKKKSCVLTYWFVVMSVKHDDDHDIDDDDDDKENDSENKDDLYTRLSWPPSPSQIKLQEVARSTKERRKKREKGHV